MAEETSPVSAETPAPAAEAPKPNLYANEGTVTEVDPAVDMAELNAQVIASLQQSSVAAEPPPEAPPTPAAPEPAPSAEPAEAEPQPSPQQERAADQPRDTAGRFIEKGFEWEGQTYDPTEISEAFTVLKNLGTMEQTANQRVQEANTELARLQPTIEAARQLKDLYETDKGAYFKQLGIQSEAPAEQTGGLWDEEAPTSEGLTLKDVEAVLDRKLTAAETRRQQGAAKQHQEAQANNILSAIDSEVSAHPELKDVAYMAAPGLFAMVQNDVSAGVLSNRSTLHQIKERVSARAKELAFKFRGDMKNTNARQLQEQAVAQKSIPGAVPKGGGDLLPQEKVSETDYGANDFGPEQLNQIILDQARQSLGQS